MDTLSLVLLLSIITALSWVVWGWHEATFNRIKNIARKNSPVIDDEVISREDQASKKHSAMSSGLLTFALGLSLTAYSNDVWILLSYLIYAAASRWLFMEMAYGRAMVGDLLHVGTGGKFDNEITTNRAIYFLIRFVFLIAAILFLIWAISR